MPRESLDLCGLWRFQPDPGWEGERAGYATPEQDVRQWREVRLPATFEDCHPGLEAYEGAGWFRRTITVPAGWQGKRVLIRFHGVNYHAQVWVNGQKVGENRDGFLPFEFAIQDIIRYGGENVIVVRADNERHAGEVPGLQRGWRTFGGILREVELEATDRLYLEHVAIVAQPATDDRRPTTDDGRPTTDSGRLAIQAQVKNECSEAVSVTVNALVADKEGKELAVLSSAPVEIEAGQGQSISIQGQVPGVQAWSPAQPHLYTVRVAIMVEGRAVDERAHMDARTIRAGFRTIEARGGKLLLNGEPIYLTGFNRHEDSPRRGMATDLEMARRDLLDMQAAGANFVRLCHYPHHPGELDLCDELGMLAMGEIPLYWWDGYAEGEENHALKLEAAGRQLATMIRRDVNHPSLIFWSVSNENKEERPEVAEGNRQLVRRAKALDPTRLAVHVSDHWRRYPNFDEDDVICVNSYPSLDRRGLAGQIDYDLAESTRFWRENLQALHTLYPDRPILISEFGYVSLRDVVGNGLGEDAQAQAIEAEFAGMDAPYVCGATIWCWADHAWPAATFGFCRYLAISPFGVVTRERKKLRAYHAVRQLFRQRRGIGEDSAASRKQDPAGDQVYMIRPHLNDIPAFAFPEGYSIRPMRPDEGGLWADIWRDADPYYSIPNDMFHSEFDHDLPATGWRSFMIVTGRDVAVGTVSAWYHRDVRGQDMGLIHWIAIRPAHQGKGLGKAAMSYAMNQLAQWHEQAGLGTQTKRIGAIRLYLDFGFRPDLELPGALASWRKVKAVLEHPGLEGVR